MNKISEIVLTVLVLAGMYCAISTSVASVRDPVIRAHQMVVVADGTDPMPICRGKACR
jgi:hypothetical protein